MALTADELKRFTPALTPHGTYVSGDDYLLVTSLNSVIGTTITLSGRMLTLSGTLVPFSHRHVPTSDRTATTSVIRLGEGWLQEFSAIAAGAAPTSGQCFIRVDLARGDGLARVILATLVQGDVTAARRRAWPGSPLDPTLGLAGALRSITGTDPAAGVEITEVVPTGARWRFISLRVALTTDATVANRVPQLTFDDGANIYAGAAGNFNHAASQVFIYHFVAAGVSHAQNSTAVQVATPANISLLAGGRIRTSTGGLQAADNYGAPQLFVEEWLEGA
jgi:hypothetical protein